MDKAEITQTGRADWWLERVTPGGRQRYPRSIRVGERGDPRVYRPERTCRIVHSGWEKGFRCTECHVLFGYDRYFESVDGRAHEMRFIYCPHCGARVVGE